VDQVHTSKIALNAIFCQGRIASDAYPACVRLEQPKRMSKDINFGLGVDILRRERGVTKRELALATGIDEGNLNRIISGRQWPSKARLEALCEYFDVNASDIFRIAEQGHVNDTSEEELRRTVAHVLIDSLDIHKLAQLLRRTGPVAQKLPPPSANDSESSERKRS